jgi:hypothetical protein
VANPLPPSQARPREWVIGRLRESASPPPCWCSLHSALGERTRCRSRPRSPVPTPRARGEPRMLHPASRSATTADGTNVGPASRSAATALASAHVWPELGRSCHG